MPFPKPSIEGNSNKSVELYRQPAVDLLRLYCQGDKSLNVRIRSSYCMDYSCLLCSISISDPRSGLVSFVVGALCFLPWISPACGEPM